MINRNKKGKGLSSFLYKCDVVSQNKFSPIILDQKKISTNVLKQCLTRLLVAETPDSNGLQQGGNEFFHVTSSPEVGKPPDVTAEGSGWGSGFCEILLL